jgi:hypothetical protein
MPSHPAASHKSVPACICHVAAVCRSECRTTSSPRRLDGCPSGEFCGAGTEHPHPVPDNAGISAEEYFNTHLADIERNPMAYAGFQKLMVRQAIAERPTPTFCEVVAATWPK